MFTNNHPLSDSEKTHYTNMWCRSVGIKARDLENHPTIDDAIILINIRSACWKYFNSKEKSVWTTNWEWVYHRQFSLKSKQLTKLEYLTHSAIYKQHQEQNNINKIKQQREQTKQNRGVNIATNPPLAARSLIGS